MCRSFGTPRSEYLKQFDQGLEWLAEDRPQLIISAGFDAHRLIPSAWDWRVKI
jgi:hypothetical protein